MGIRGTVMVALSGGVDSAVAAWLLREQGLDVECLHMTNWEDDAYCSASEDLQDARRICRQLDLPLHRVNFSDEYKARVFKDFVAEHERGRTPNPDVLCNREIKFGLLLDYALRLGADWLATGHYARLDRSGAAVELLKGSDAGKDQSYFLHALDGVTLGRVLFPVGELDKQEVRSLARRAGLATAEKKDSTGICFIGKRPFADFLRHYVRERPGPMLTPTGEQVGEHRGLPFYTLGQRQGLGIGGTRTHSEEPWYVAGKRAADNALIVVQGHDHPLLLSDQLEARAVHWINAPPAGLFEGATLRLAAKTRYRQVDQACAVRLLNADSIELTFERAQRAVTPGQYAVIYDGDRCLGGARIETAGCAGPSLHVQAG